MKCQNCNHLIKRIYTWKNQVLGIECWKKIALPEIERIRQEKWAIYKKIEWEKSFALVEALKKKDFSKIKSEFKIKFLQSLIKQFEEKGFISKKQKDMVYGSGQWNGSFYDFGMLNKKDRLNELIITYHIGDEKTKNWCKGVMEALYPAEKDKKYFEEGII